MKSPLRTLSISVLGLTVAALVGLSTAGSASAHTQHAPTVSSAVSANSWSWGGVPPIK